MSKDERKVPELRFKGFHDDWEQRKLGDIGSVAMNRRIFKSETTPDGEIPFYKIGTFGKAANAFITKEKFEEYKQKYPYPQIGDTLISASGSIGRTVVYEGEDAYYQDSNIVWLKHNGKIDNTFLNQFYNVVKWSGIEGTTIKRLYNKDILETKITLPNIVEQKKIGFLLYRIDSAINLHQRKINILKQMKIAYFNGLFPNENCNIPMLRFNNYQEVWEESPLKEVGDSVRTSVQPQSEPDSEFIEYSMPAYDNGRLPVHVLGKSMQSMRLKISGQVLLINKLNVRQKRIWLIENAPYNAVASTEFMPFTSKKINLMFLEQYMLSDKATRDLESISSGTSNSQKRVTPTDILKYHIKYPKEHNEQENIGLYFKQIDNIIVLYHKKMYTLKKIKNLYLNKFFI